MTTTRTKQIELRLPSVIGYEKIARRAAEALGYEIKLPQDRIEDIKTAVAEACMNAIEHGNRLKADNDVIVLMQIAPDKLEIYVADVGEQPMPDQLPEPGSKRYRGWGMFFIQQLVDEVHIVRLPDGGNQVHMIVYLTPSPGAAETAGTAAQPERSNGTRALQAVAPQTAAIQPARLKFSAILPATPKPSAILPVAPPPSAIQPAANMPRAIQPAVEVPRTIQTTGPSEGS